ncbi:opioid growth factor receptor-related protein [Singulisphaera sp. Ch08]|uniref:Opioid growth factor receptor-related protein n=1 Tax=Singulisphaera sp. Ch08 TaxID=3120278 RepID=A0AAU7CRN2_9BACT
MSRLTEFYKGTGKDSEGRTISMIWAFRRDQLETTHDYIQWLFPLRLASRFNPDAPLLTEADVAAFHDDPALRENLKRSFTRFLDFLDLREDGGRVVKTEEFDRSGIFQGPNHNWLRITRVLTSTRILGLESESRAFFEFLKRLWEEGESGITTDTFRYWEDAATGDLSG